MLATGSRMEWIFVSKNPGYINDDRRTHQPLNLLPLLRFRPGGVQKELAVRRLSGAKGIIFAQKFQKLISIFGYLSR